MSIITIISLVISLCAIFSFINFKFFKLPPTIGVMLVSIIFSGLLIGSNYVGYNFTSHADKILNQIDFTETVLHGMLGLLLFAGALHVNINELAKHKIIIFILAFGGTIFSTIAVGLFTYYLLPLFGISISLIYCLIFGALISPTDPIAVMSILRRAGVSKSLETKVVGESLFNDGIAVVIFLTLLAVLNTGQIDAEREILTFVQEFFGGLGIGFAIGYIAFLALKSIDNYQLEILITLAVVMGGYELSRLLHTSGPIAMVVAGLLIGNVGKRLAMSDKTKQNLDNFWELIDEFLNVALFLLLGLEILRLTINESAIYSALIIIPVLLMIRLSAVSLPIICLRKYIQFSPNAIKILTWGGLRGGISVALVLSLPNGAERDFLMVITYIIVLFSIFVQGLTVGKLAK